MQHNVTGGDAGVHEGILDAIGGAEQLIGDERALLDVTDARELREAPIRGRDPDPEVLDELT